MTRIEQALNAGWLTVVTLKTPYIQQSLMLELDRGESAAIALALESEIQRILIDEADGRTTARVMGLRPTGVLGILLRAKHEGKITSLSNEMFRLRNEAGFFIDEPLFQRLLREAGES